MIKAETHTTRHAASSNILKTTPDQHENETRNDQTVPEMDPSEPIIYYKKYEVIKYVLQNNL